MGRWLRKRPEIAELEAQQAQLIRDAMQDADPGTPMRDGPATAGGDPQRLRGIPAIGRSVSGAIRGTDPEREATRRADRDP